MLVDLGHGVKINCRIIGEGFPVILIMGFGATMDLWGEGFTGSLSKHFKVLIFDNRGTGGSVAPDGPITMAQFAQDIVGLMDQMGFAKAHIIGISMGGMIAQQLAVTYPERISKLVLGATTCAAKYVKKSPALLSLLFFRFFPKWAMRAMVSAEFIEQNPKVIEAMQRYAQTHPSNFSMIRLQSAAIRGYDLSEKISAIRLPTLVIAGTGDKIINVENSDIIAQKIPAARLIKFPGVGHMFPLEKEQATSQAILEFFGLDTPKS